MQLEANMLQAIVKADLFDSQGNLFFKKDIPLLQQILNEQISQFVANLPVSQSRKAEIASDLETAYDLELLLSTARGEEVAGVTRSGVYIFRDKNGHLHM